MKVDHDNDYVVNCGNCGLAHNFFALPQWEVQSAYETSPQLIRIVFIPIAAIAAAESRVSSNSVKQPIILHSQLQAVYTTQL